MLISLSFLLFLFSHIVHDIASPLFHFFDTVHTSVTTMEVFFLFYSRVDARALLVNMCACWFIQLQVWTFYVLFDSRRPTLSVNDLRLYWHQYLIAQKAKKNNKKRLTGGPVSTIAPTFGTILPKTLLLNVLKIKSHF